ncbi:hypothetical protein C8J57DRAFT_1650062 [Mycena rebaudengoi]|nr:hypothetical protein C8J57DRAFT_1650062 [Mycena rebaudengoi]
MSKRPGSPSSSSGTPGSSTQIAASSDRDKSKGLVQRTSGLDTTRPSPVSPARMGCGEILSYRFDPTGQKIAACSAGRTASPSGAPTRPTPTTACSPPSRKLHPCARHDDGQCVCTVRAAPT